MSQLEAHPVPKWESLPAFLQTPSRAVFRVDSHANGVLPPPGVFWKRSSNNKVFINGCSASKTPRPFEGGIIMRVLELLHAVLFKMKEHEHLG
jgi:hypothetical protein